MRRRFTNVNGIFYWYSVIIILIYGQDSQIILQFFIGIIFIRTTCLNFGVNFLEKWCILWWLTRWLIPGNKVTRVSVKVAEFYFEIPRLMLQSCYSYKKRCRTQNVLEIVTWFLDRSQNTNTETRSNWLDDLDDLDDWTKPLYCNMLCI